MMLIDYRSIGGNTYEIRINWSTLTNISEFLSDSTMMKILEVKAVKSSIPQIDKYTGKVRVYYEKECKAKIRSIIRVDQSAEVCCPEGMNVLEKIYTRMINGQTYSFVDVSQYLSCGTKCCYREYNVTCNYDDVYNFFVYDVSVPTTYSVNSCSTMSSYVDCLDPNLPIPCVDGDCEE